MIWTDIRHTVRGLLRVPAFLLICILTLALGIGATTSIFSAIYHTMLRPMPFENGDRLAYIWVEDSVSSMGMSPPNAWADAWRGKVRSFDAIEAYTSHEYTVMGGDEPELVKGAAISRGLPQMLGVSPIVGRVFTAEEMQRNAPNVALITESMWKKRFGGNRDAIGKQVAMSDGTKYEVVGVLPNNFSAFADFQREGQLFVPLRPDSTSQVRDMSLIGRMKEGVTDEAANAELALLVTGLKSEMMPGKWAPKIMKPDAFVDGTTKTGLPILFVAVAAVLLIGCANIAGLLLVRLNYRRRELAIRAAVGAARGSILRLLALESLLLALTGGVLGMVISSWLTNAIRAARPQNLNSLDAITIDAPTLLFALCVAFATALFFGVGPAVAAVRRDLTGGLLTGVGSSGRVTSGNRVRSVMVGGQIALSLVLLVASLVLVRSVRQLQRRDLGFNPSNVLTMRVQTPGNEYAPDPSREPFTRALVDKLQHIPGVTAVSVSSSVPSKGGVMFGELSIPGRVLTEAEKTSLVGFVQATPDYMKTIGLRLKQGRFFNEKEDGNPVVINESWAKLLWPAGNAVGQQFRLGDPRREAFTVIGVVQDVATMGPALKNDRPQIYTPYSWGFGGATFAMRTDGRDPSSLAAAARDAVHSLSATALTRDVATLDGLMADTISLNRFYMMLLSSFAGLALLLSVIGLYGVISNAVAQRTREIGVRMALGATPGGVRSMIFRQAVRIVFVGLVIGAGASMYLVSFLGSALNGFSPYDPFSYGVAIVVLTAGALFATYVPARRAVRVDPLMALRAE